MVDAAGGSERKGMMASDPLGAGTLNVDMDGGGREMTLPMKAMVAIHLTLSFGSTAKAEWAQYLKVSIESSLDMCGRHTQRPTPDKHGRSE